MNSKAETRMSGERDSRRDSFNDQGPTSKVPYFDKADRVGMRIVGVLMVTIVIVAGMAYLVRLLTIG